VDIKTLPRNGFAVILVSMVITATLATFHSLVYVNLGLDDPYITFRYSLHFVEGYGLVWNPGEDPVEGYTNFFWAMLNAGAIAIGWHPLAFSKVVGVISTLLIVILPLTKFNILLDYFSSKIAVALLIALAPVIAVYSQSGMETSFFTLLIFAASLTYIHSCIYSNIRSVYIASVLFAIAALNRPEGLGFFGLTVLFEIYRSGKNPRTIISNALQITIPFMIIWLPYYLWRFSFYGYLFPNTFYAKHTGGGVNQLVSGVMYISRAFSLYLGIPFALILGLLAHLSSRQRNEATKISDKQKITILYLSFIIICYLGYILLVGSDDTAAFPSVRFIVPILPMLYLLVGVSIEVIDIGKYKRIIVLALSVSMITISGYTEIRDLLIRTNPALGTRDSVLEVVLTVMKPRSDLYEEPELAEWINAQDIEIIAVPWAGKVPYFSDVVVIDTLGLNDEHIAHHGKSLQRGAATKTDPEYVLSRRPDLIFMNVDKSYPLGLSSFQEAGGWRIGEQQMIKLLSENDEYELVTNAPVGGTVYRLRK
jgi:hypothetical protein